MIYVIPKRGLTVLDHSGRPLPADGKYVNPSVHFKRLEREKSITVHAKKPGDGKDGK